MHSPVSTGVAFGILFVVVGASFAYVSGNPVELPKEPYLGIDGVNVNQAIADALELQEPRGILVTRVLDASPADKAGLHGATKVETIGGRQVPIGGDVIIAINDISVKDDTEAEAVLADKHVGDSVKFTIIRGSVTLNLNAILEEKPSS